MSGLADNPYRDVLTARAKLYGIRPAGQSFLHLELGTTHLLHAVDRYLEAGAGVACLVPGTILNGHHHEPLRRRDFLHSKRPVALDIAEVWQVEPGTFKYPGAAIIGHKGESNTKLPKKDIKGFLAQKSGLVAAEFSERVIGSQRIAWILEKEGLPISCGGMKELPQQGADLMPRTAVCIDIEKKIGAEYQVNTPKRSSRWGFTVKSAKEMSNEYFPGHIASRYIYRMAQSENLLPFVLGEDCAPVAIPAERQASGAWKILNDADIRRAGFVQSARRFTAINDKLKNVGQGKSLQERINERGKLTKQVFAKDGYLLIAGAGGKHICAACLPVDEANSLVIDQTLYWKVIPQRDAAWFYVGMLNSQALTEAIAPFNPKGAFGERHIHALPYRLLPAFESANEDHMRIAELAEETASIARSAIASDAYLSDTFRQLPARRRRLRQILIKTNEVRELETLCAAALGTSAVIDEPEESPSDLCD